MTTTTTLSPLCVVCVSANQGSCTNNGTCRCYSGFIGPNCLDRVTTAKTETTTTSLGSVNVIAIIAGILGGALLTLIIGLVLFFWWRRRAKQRSMSLISSNRTTTTTLPSREIPSDTIVAPALYSIRASRRSSVASSVKTISYHLYEEL